MVVWERKLYRVIMGSLCPGIYLLARDAAIPLILAAVFLFLLLWLEFERYYRPGVWTWLLRRFGGIFKTAPGRLTGETCFMISTFVSLALFPAPVAIANLFFLVFGDAASAIVGIRWGRVRVFPGKTLAGLCANIAVNSIVAALLLLILPITAPALWTGVLLGGLLEVLPLHIDDNLTVGIIPGAAMSFLYSL